MTPKERQRHRRQPGWRVMEPRDVDRPRSVCTVICSDDESCIRAVLHILHVFSVHLSPGGNGTSLRVNLQPLGSVPQNPIPEGTSCDLE